MTRMFHLCLVVGLIGLADLRAFADNPSDVLNGDSRMLFVDTPFQDVIRFLSDQHDIRISLAPGVDGSERVTFDADGPFGALLSHLLHPMHLECRVVGDSLLFAPIERSKYVEWRRQRAEQERVEREQEQHTCRSLEAAGGRLARNDLGWITEVELRGASVRDSDAVLIRHFRRLSRLDLSGSAITNATLEELNGLTRLTVLAVGGTLITDEGLAHLKTLRHLETLDVADTRVTDDGLQKLANLRSLHTVYVESTGITTEGTVKLRKSGARVRAFDDRPVRPSQTKEKKP